MILVKNQEYEKSIDEKNIVSSSSAGYLTVLTNSVTAPKTPVKN